MIRAAGNSSTTADSATTTSDVSELRSQLAALQQHNDTLQETILKLQQDIALLQRQLYGRRTERLSAAETQLVMEELLGKNAALSQALEERLAAIRAEAEAANRNANRTGKPAPTDPKRNKPQGRRNLAALDLPRIVVEIASAAEEARGAERAGYESSFELARNVGGFVVVEKQHVRYRTADSAATTEIVVASAPPRAIERGMLHESTLAYLLTAKFALGVPHHRLEAQLATTDVRLDRSLMSRAAEQCGNLLGATIVAAQWRYAREYAAVISTDATGAAIQPEASNDKQSRSCKRGHFFTAVVDADHVLFQYVEAHTQANVATMFDGYAGYLQADASSVYHVLEREPIVDDESSIDEPVKRVTLVGCWAHLRRYFFEAAVCKYPVGAAGLSRIAAVFAADKQIARMPNAGRLAARRRLLGPLMLEFFDWAASEQRLASGRNRATAALGYAHNQRDELLRVLDDIRLPLDNTRAERALRPVVIGRKNWLFHGSDTHADSAAALFSIIASCRLHRIDPEQYLSDVLRLVPQWPNHRYLELCPAQWRATRARLRPAELERHVAFFTIPDVATG